MCSAYSPTATIRPSAPSTGRPVVTLQLGQVERLIANQLTSGNTDFIRIGKSLIINRQYINYINIQKQQLALSDGKSASIMLTASKEALKQLKDLLVG